ncbi:AAA family ATPase [Desulfotomaculum copahuensis]|uniref:Nuclease SbcCD subunit C n=1 Tax=Desulfotomaculum copahuensis TaxID=1838280 RepID=A0A1B7LDF2_9FIRM|nr:SMC family ATPase [Desulfotomaculum copahuensis]OAT81081.1 hypothetical protein A6M21_11745 [Desulfotomaculum copahuensis]
MEPIKISLTNFGTYSHEDVDLSGIHLAVVSGPNGAGKSTLFTDSLLYALFGASRTGNLDDLVRKGEQDMAVEVQFILNGQEYRVMRSRSTKGRGKSGLELQVRNGDEWLALSGSNIRDTEKRIQDLLKVTQETFTSSCLILQGRSNEFTVKGPAERKKVLGEILGLEVYDRLQAAAKEKAKALDGEIKALKDRQAAIEIQLAEVSDLEARKSDIEASIAQKNATIASLQEQLDHVKRQQAELEAKAAQFDGLSSEDDRLEREIATLQQERAGLEHRVDRARKMLASEQQILAKVKECEQVKARIAALEAKLPRLQAVADEARKLESQKAQASRTIAQVVGQIREIEAVLSNRAELEAAAEQYQKATADLETIDAIGEQWLALDQQVKDARRIWERASFELEARTRELEKELQALKTKAAMLEDSGCIDPERASCRFLADAQQAKAKMAEVQTELNALDKSEVERLEQTWCELQAKKDAIGYDPSERQRLRNLVTSLRHKAEQAAQLGAKAELLQNLKHQERQLRESLADIEARHAALNDEGHQLQAELKDLQALKASLPNLERWAAAKDELPAARQTVAEAEQRFTWYREQIVERTARRAEIARQLEERVILWAEQSKLGNEATSLKANIDECNRALSALQRELGMVEQRLKAIDALRAEAEDLTGKLAQIAALQVKYQTLVRAFGRDGIPALIIENAIPELESITNEILGRMTSNGMNLRFETQRELKSVKGAVSETLDIIISDWRGERPYETFSGGEKFRIDFAIRIALSKLLARRAGASLRLLVLDEGIGSQDAEGRERLMEAIAAIEKDFAKVIVISHVEEIKEAFPTRIEVEPGPDGSKVRVA